MVNETHKIMGDDTHPRLADDGARAGAHRPFARRSTSSSTARSRVEQAREALRQAPGVVVLDDPAKGEVPLPLDAARAATRCSSAASAATRRCRTG